MRHSFPTRRSSDLGELREGLKQIRQELNDHYTDIAEHDGFSKQMWSFMGRATSKIEYLVDDVTHAEITFHEVVRYYGEDDQTMSSTEFFAIFKTFVTSYRKCKAENQTAAEEKLAVEKRKQMLAETREKRQNQRETGPQEEDSAVLDNLLVKLRNGDTVNRRSRKTRNKPDWRPAVPLLNADTVIAQSDTADMARNMLAQLQADGFTAPSPVTPTPRRRTRKRTAMLSEAEETSSAYNSPLAVHSELPENNLTPEDTSEDIPQDADS